MGLLNLVGSVAAGAGEGYGKGKAAVGAISLESIIQEAKMLKEDNLARLRQSDQNTFTAEQGRLSRDAAATLHADDRKAQADLTREGWTETGKRESERREAEANDYATSPQWGLNPKTGKYDQFVSNKRGEVKWLNAGDGGLLELTKGKGGKGDGDAVEKMPEHVMALFKTPDTFDGMGNKTAEGGVDSARLGKFIAFKSKYGRDMTYEDAAAQFLNQEGGNAAPKPGLDSIFGAKEEPKAETKASPAETATKPQSDTMPNTAAMVSDLNAGRGLDKTLFGKPVFARYSREQIMGVWDQLRPDVQQAYEQWWNQKSEPPKGLISGANPYSRNGSR